jgi:predicted porin
MQVKRLVAASVATLIAAAPLFAKAQTNVALYGVVEAAVESSDNGGPDGRQTRVQSGNLSGSRFGFRGTEDLGNGLKAIFNLEAGFAGDTGMQDSAGLFQRRAVVGLEGAFGTLTLGREYSPIAAIAGATDISGQGFYGSNLSAFGSGRVSRRLANSVNYKSASFNGFDILATYSAGEKSTGPSGDLKGIAAEFKQGGLYLGVGYHTYKRVSTGDDKEYGAGAGYKFADIGGLEVMANYLSADPDGANNKFKQYNLGAAYPFGPSKVYVNLQQNKIENGAKGNAWMLGYTYSLSKRTDLYASYANMDNNGLGNFGLSAGSNSLNPPATSLGADPSVFTVGLRHKF